MKHTPLWLHITESMQDIEKNTQQAQQGHNNSRRIK